MLQASLAQLVEHFTRNEGVVRSSRMRSFFNAKFYRLRRPVKLLRKPSKIKGLRFFYVWIAPSFFRPVTNSVTNFSLRVFLPVPKNCIRHRVRYFFLLLFIRPGIDIERGLDILMPHPCLHILDVHAAVDQDADAGCPEAV